MDVKLPKVSFEDDPRRCWSKVGQDQCPHISIEGTNKCDRHTSGPARQSRNPLSNYKFSQQFQGKISDFASSEDVKSLRAEIGVLRLLLQTLVNNCGDEMELSLNADRIGRLVDNINKTVTNCHRLEAATGQLLDKTVVINIGNMIVGVVDKYITDKTILDQIGAEIYECVATSSSPENLHRAVA